MASKSKVYFFFEMKLYGLSHRSKLKTLIEYLFRNEGKQLSHINYVFCSDKRMLEINRQYLSHDYYTDIITFDLSEGSLIEAEVYISIDRVRENARTHEVSIKQELHRVILHGALHLCGYADKSKKDRDEMRVKEEEYLTKYFSRFT